MTDKKSMAAQNDDTICALATPSGAGGIGVIRISGPEAFIVADRVSAQRGSKKCVSYGGHTLHRAAIIETSGEVIDDVLLAVFHGPRSYTGEDVIEISAHGGLVPLRRIIARLLESGARLARPGEFTQRAVSWIRICACRNLPGRTGRSRRCWRPLTAAFSSAKA